jgi:hypothetical protein
MILRIFRDPVFIIAVWTMNTIIVIWIAAFLFSSMLQCIPFSLNWTALGDNNFQCIDENMMYLAQASSDVFNDREYRTTNDLLLMLKRNSPDSLDADSLRKLHEHEDWIVG